MTILEILEAHQRSFRNGRCSCEEYGPKRTFEEHHAHLAEVLEKYMQEAKAEALAEAAFDLPAGMSRKGFYKWLRTRANQYKETE